jgi:hypothetical protein
MARAARAKVKPPRERAAVSHDVLRDDRAYNAYLECLQARFFERVAGKPLFTTDVQNLFTEYLAYLPDEVRQWHNCHACRRFINTYGILVTINADGATAPILWDTSDAPAEIADGIERLQALVAKAKVTGVFYSAKPVWGEPITGEWRHLAVTPPRAMIWNRATQTAFQGSAEKREDYKNILFALNELPLSAVIQAITLLKTDSLYRSEKCLGVATWLHDLHVMRTATKNKAARENLTWLAVATAPAGFCHPRASMIGTLLTDIIAGLPFDDVAAKFKAKMHPLQYQRPQAEPSAGNIAQAEKVIEQLAAAGALARRFARVEELQALWRPREAMREESPSKGVFAHLKPKGTLPTPNMNIPPVVLTWEKFCRTVLIEAEQIEYWVTPRAANYCALVTACDQDAPPILQWDTAADRNPVSWYVYHRGSTPDRWNLEYGAMCPVTAVTYQPSMWKGELDHQGASTIFILQGARDLHSKGTGLALFPEILKSEFHGIRATIEAFSRRGELVGADEASACGIRLQKGSQWNDVFRVTSKGTAILYQLDRWD